MAGTEDITLRVVLDDRQAKAGLEGLRNGTAGLAQAAAGAAGADGGGGGLASLNDELSSLSAIGTASSTALGRVSSSLGRIAPRAGRAIGAVGRLGTALGAGGPLAIAVLAAGEGISWLIGKYDETSKAAEESARAQIEAISKTADHIKRLTEGVQDRIARLLGINEAQQAMGQLDIKVKNAAASLDNLKSAAGRQKFFADFVADGGKVSDAADAYKQKIKESEEALEPLRKEFEKASPAFAEYNKQLAIANRLEERKKELDDEARQALLGKTAAVRQYVDTSFDAMKAVEDLFAPEIKARKEREKALEQAKKEREKALKEQEKINQKAEEARTKLEEKHAKERQRIADEEKAAKEQAIKSTASDIMSLTNIVVNASDQLISDLITGQEKAFERFAVNIMRQAGTVMLGKGMELGANGIVNLMTGNPVGAGQLAVAAGLIGGGLALGAAATGVEHIAMGSGGSATTATASAGPATTSTPMGAGRISGSQREGGGRVQEAVTYVFNAPVFGDQNRSAKHVALLQRRASRDLLLA